MHAWDRPEEPECLRWEERVRLTKAFVREKWNTGKTPGCTWPQAMNEDGTPETLPRWVAKSTQHHCTYCDSMLGHAAEPTLDHFRPKSKYALQAYRWSNLYVCCRGCQRKGTGYHKDVLRPDEPGYEFSRYFRYRRNGEICVATCDAIDQRRAEKTLEILKLNDETLRAERERAFTQHAKPRARPLPPGLDPAQAQRLLSLRSDSREDIPFRDFFRQGVME